MFAIKISLLFVITNSLAGPILVICNNLEETNKAYLAPFLNKKYELVSSDEKFDEIMQALGVGTFKRNLAKLAKPVVQLTEKDGVYTLKSDSIFKNTQTSFKIGEEFDEETPDGRNVKSLFMQDKNKLVQIQHGNNKTTTVEREFKDDELIITVRLDKIVSVRKYKSMK